MGTTIDDRLIENSKDTLKAIGKVNEAQDKIKLIIEDQKSFFSKVLMFLGFKKDDLPAAQSHLTEMKIALEKLENEGAKLNTSKNAAIGMAQEGFKLGSQLTSGISSMVSMGVSLFNNTSGITEDRQQLQGVIDKLKGNVASKAEVVPEKSTNNRFGEIFKMLYTPPEEKPATNKTSQSLEEDKDLGIRKGL